jgi:hypothetical protein
MPTPSPSQSTVDVRDTSERSLGELMGELTSDMSTLFRKEVELAKVELMDSVKHAGKGAGLFSASGLLGLYAFAVFIATAVIALDLAWPLWLAALVVAVALAAAAAIAALIGKKEVSQATPVADRAVETAKADVEEIKEAVRHDR